jgi:hypothetical protein
MPHAHFTGQRRAGALGRGVAIDIRCMRPHQLRMRLTSRCCSFRQPCPVSFAVRPAEILARRRRGRAGAAHRRIAGVARPLRHLPVAEKLRGAATPAAPARVVAAADDCHASGGLDALAHQAASFQSRNPNAGAPR